MDLSDLDPMYSALDFAPLGLHFTYSDFFLRIRISFLHGSILCIRSLILRIWTCCCMYSDIDSAQSHLDSTYLDLALRIRALILHELILRIRSLILHIWNSCSACSELHSTYLEFDSTCLGLDSIYLDFVLHIRNVEIYRSESLHLRILCDPAAPRARCSSTFS